MTRRDIRACLWYEELAEHFGVDPALLRAAAPDARAEADDLPAAAREARAELRRRFMTMQTQALLDRLERWEPARVTDVERSTVWKEYVFVCVNGEKRAFERMAFYDRLLRAVVAPLAADARPLAADARRPLVVDYGCGSSLFTRMIAQDFGDGVRTVSADVCRYAVDFSVARNRVHNRTAEGLVVDDVLAPLPALGAQLILAYAVFEHLPNSIVQIKGLIDALAPGGILIENYSGHSSETPHKSDTFSAYRSRDVNLDALASALTLLHGTLPDKRGGVYGHDAGDRYWIKGPATSEVARAVAAALRREDSFSRRWAGRLARRLGRAPWRALRRAPWRASR